jgi:hypothetical protein
MKHVVKKLIPCAIVLSGTCALSDNGCASGPFTLQHAVVAGGGSSVSGGTYQLTDTIAQSTIAVRVAGQYVLFDGFWGPFGTFDVDLIFADGFESF